jgi:hypothetical protein
LGCDQHICPGRRTLDLPFGDPSEPLFTVAIGMSVGWESVSRATRSLLHRSESPLDDHASNLFWARRRDWSAAASIVNGRLVRRRQAQTDPMPVTSTAYPLPR